MNVGSLFTGVGGFDLGLERAGHRVVFQCESDEWRRRVLKRHWPRVRCYEDVRSVHAVSLWRDGEQGTVDLLYGGFPCQDLSVAGRRAGFQGERSSLFFEFARIAGELVQPGGWVLIENVPGLLSSHGGRDFAVLLATLAEFGFHDLAWRVLDSRHFGVPQRRRRVFILARRACGRSAFEVLLEPEGGSGDSEARGEAGTRVAASLTSGSHGSGVNTPGRRKEDDVNVVVNALDRRRGGADDNEAQAGHLISATLKGQRGKGGGGIGPEETLVAGTVRSHVRPGSNDNGGVVAPALVRRYAKGTDSDATDALVTHTLRAEGFDASEDGTGRGTPLVTGFNATQHPISNEQVMGALSDQGAAVASAASVRRLTPTECERLQGFPDGWTIPYDGATERDPKPDGPRYAAMGDAVTVPVIEWLGHRLMAYEFNAKAAA